TRSKRDWSSDVCSSDLAGLAVTAQVKGEEAYARQLLTQPAELAVPGVRAEGEAVDKHDRQRFRAGRLCGRVPVGTYLIPAQGDVRAAVADGEDAGGAEVAGSRPDVARCAGRRGQAGLLFGDLGADLRGYAAQGGARDAGEVFGVLHCGAAIHDVRAASVRARCSAVDSRLPAVPAIAVWSGSGR